VLWARFTIFNFSSIGLVKVGSTYKYFLFFILIIN
jgi:hypothetical protein